MADMLHTNLSNSSVFSLFSPLYLSPHSYFSFVRFAPLRRRFSHSSVVTKLCSDSSQFDIISTTELSDGSVSFKFGDASEIYRNLGDLNGGNEVELERESGESIEDNAVINGQSDTDKIKAEYFDRNSVELKENADTVVELVSDAQFSESSIEAELDFGLISAGGIENLSDFDAGMYENHGGNGSVTVCDSSVGVVIGKDAELSDEDDEVEHGGGEPSNVGGTSLDVEASVVVEALKDEIVKDEVVSLEDEFVKKGVVTDDIVDVKIVSLEEEDIVEGEILKTEIEEDEILKGGIVDKTVEDEIEEDKAVFSVKETVQGDNLKDDIVEDGIEADKTVSLVVETVKDDIVKDDIVKDEIEEDKALSSAEETVIDDVEEGKVVFLVDKAVKGNIAKDEIAKDDIDEGNVVSLVEETVNGEIVKDEIVEGDVVSLVEETVDVDTVKDKIVEDEIEENDIVSLAAETMKVDIEEEKVVSLMDETMKGNIEEDKAVSLMDETVKGSIVKDEIVENETAEENEVALEDGIVKGDTVKDSILEDKVVSLEHEIMEDGIVEDEIVKRAVVKYEIAEVTAVSLEDEPEKVCAFTINHPISLDEDGISAESISKKLEAEPILVEETSSDSQDDVVGLGSLLLGSNKVHDAIINTVTQSGDDTTDSLVAAGPITSEIISPETDIDSRNEAEPSSPALSISTAVASLEHSPEDLTGGEDAYFVFKNWFGVADGIGQWSLGGVDMGLYAHEFMQNCKKLLNSRSAGLTNVKQLLQQSAAITQSTGAARVLIAHLDKEVLHVANIGDTGFVIIRNGTVFQKSSPMVHEFSFPYAIGLGDDLAEDAEEYHIDLEDGDVIVTATDGLFDNLYDREIASMVSKVLEAGMSVQDLAELLATTSAEVGRSESARSPFADAAKAAGHPGYSGGKLDHVTVIVSLVQKI